MVKIIHTSDWHLGQNFYHYNREEEYIDFFVQLHQLVAEEQPDALLVCGDVFDQAAPPTWAVAMYNREMVKLKQAFPTLQVVVTAGNHDSPSRLSASGVLWQELGVTVMGTLPRTPEGSIEEERLIVPIRRNNEVVAWVLAVPYLYGGNLPPVEDDDSYPARMSAFYKRLRKRVEGMRTADQPVIAMGHFTLANCELAGHTAIIGNIEAVSSDEWAEEFDYTALGHIHRPQHIGSPNVRYSGSVLPVSFDEPFPHSITVVEFEGDKMRQVRKREIRPLIEICNVPDEHRPFDEVKQALLDFPADKRAYIRVKVLLEGITSPIMYEEALACLQGKAASLCLLHPVRCEAASSDSLSEEVISDWEVLQHVSPLDIALKAYREKYSGEEMPKEAQNCLQQLIEESRLSVNE